MVTRHEAIEATLLEIVDTSAGNPVAFLIRTSDLTCGRNAQSHWMAEAGAKDFDIGSIGVTAEQGSAVRQLCIAGFEEVEPALGISLQITVIGMLAGAGMPGISEAFVEVSFAIVIEIVQLGDLASFQHMDDAIDDFQP